MNRTEQNLFDTAAITLFSVGNPGGLRDRPGRATASST
jgi:hypothetical protein